MDTVIEGLRHLIAARVECGLYRVDYEPISNGKGQFMSNKITLACHRGDNDFNVEIYCYEERKLLIVNGARKRNVVEKALQKFGFVDMDANDWKVEII